MAQADLVRTSRDGDQFHYLRAARLCLELLQLGTSLAAVTVEGTSPDEEITEGLNVIDLALYHGSTAPDSASQIAYRQFKHSTLHAAEEWTDSGLTKTLVGFAARYEKLIDTYGADDASKRFRFEFETNRPIAPTVFEALSDLVEGKESERSAYFRGKLSLTGSALQSFAKLVSLIPNVPGYLTQRSLLEQGLGTYLPDNDKDAPLQLKDLVARKATTEFERNPQIRRQDVLDAIGAREHSLFPAPALIETPRAIVRREQLPLIAAEIVASSDPIIIQAGGGVGKSITATTLSKQLPPYSVGFVYDCFGNGGYRSASEYRHRPQDGLVQLANEMASAGLCDPLLPSNKADDSAYVRAFITRVRQVSDQLTNSGDGLLLIVIDAADNAETASQEASDGPSFPRLLLREKLPANVRLVLTARPYRVESLVPPPEVKLITLQPFSESETAAKLRAHFPDATSADVREFHRLTSHNPRVQSAALAVGDTVGEVLTQLGPNPRTVSNGCASICSPPPRRGAEDRPGRQEVRTAADDSKAALLVDEELEREIPKFSSTSGAEEGQAGTAPRSGNAAAQETNSEVSGEGTLASSAQPSEPPVAPDIVPDEATGEAQRVAPSRSPTALNYHSERRSRQPSPHQRQLASRKPGAQPKLTML
jgi:hypothetical protein